MDNFFTIEMQSAGIQVLESSYIIGTSKNIETIKSRQDFLLQRLQSLKQGQSNSQYSTCVGLTTEHYKTMYYDRPLQDYQLEIISNPNGFDINNFYCNSLVNAMKRFCAEQLKEINAMKKENAKAKRAAKVLATIGITKTELQTKCSTSAGYPTALTELENLETTFNPTI
jgi:hypothetical protein